MKILLIFRFFHYIWLTDTENLCFTLILRENMLRLDGALIRGNTVAIILLRHNLYLGLFISYL